jgi:hypothetical protein
LGLDKGICSVKEAAEFNNKDLMKREKLPENMGQDFLSL